MSEADSISIVRYQILDEIPAYRVGNDGTVWTRTNGRFGFKDRWRPLKASVLPNGYRAVYFQTHGVSSIRYVHRLVLEAFVGPAPAGMMCAHNNGDRLDNRLENLRWDTPANNSADKHKHGTMLRGESHPNSKLTKCSAEKVWELWDAGLNCVDIGREIGVSDGIVRCVLRGITWVEVAPHSGPLRGRIPRRSCRPPRLG